MNSVITIKIITLHLHSTLQQNEFQSNLPNSFTKDHLAESQRVSSGVGPAAVHSAYPDSRELAYWAEEGRHTDKKLPGTLTASCRRAQCYSMLGTCLLQVNAAISENDHGWRVSDLIKTGVLPSLERRNSQTNRFSTQRTT